MRLQWRARGTNLVLITIAMLFLGCYVLLNTHQCELPGLEAGVWPLGSLVRRSIDVPAIHALYYEPCAEEDLLVSENSSIPVCHPGFECVPELEHSLPFHVSMAVHDLHALEQTHPSMRMGGQWAPCDCISASRLAIIIPYRDRREHLHVLLNNLIPFLQLQRTAFRIFLIEQTGEELFNRAAVMNAGFLEASALGEFDCIVFHDVDLLPLDACNLYRCHANPTHLAVAMDKFDFALPYKSYCGGVLAMTSQAVRTLNGFTNVMYGWGGEDDDIYARIRRHGYNVTRYASHTGRYRMIRHEHDKLNPPLERTYHVGECSVVLIPNSMRESGGHWKYSKYDGLNSANYTVRDLQLTPLYTNITITLDGGPRSKEEGRTMFKEAVRRLRTRLTNDPDERTLILDVVRSLRAANSKKFKVAQKVTEPNQ